MFAKLTVTTFSLLQKPPHGAVVKNPPSSVEDYVWSLGWEDPLEKKMATHSSILVWRIPWTEEAGRLYPMGSQRVRHSWAHTYIQTHTHTPPLKQSLTFSAAIALSKEVSSFIKPRLVFFLTSSMFPKWLRTSAPCGWMSILPPWNLPELQPSCKAISTHPVYLLPHQQKEEEE